MLDEPSSWSPISSIHLIVSSKSVFSRSWSAGGRERIGAAKLGISFIERELRRPVFTGERIYVEHLAVLCITDGTENCVDHVVHANLIPRRDLKRSLHSMADSNPTSMREESVCVNSHSTLTDSSFASISMDCPSLRSHCSVMEEHGL